MADYSDKWFCEECKSGGTMYTGDHKEWCSVTLRRVTKAREKHLAEEAEKKERHEREAAWANMPENEFFALMWESQNTFDEAYTEYAEAKRELDKFREFIRGQSDSSMSMRWSNYSKEKYSNQ